VSSTLYAKHSIPPTHKPKRLCISIIPQKRDILDNSDGDCDNFLSWAILDMRRLCLVVFDCFVWLNGYHRVWWSGGGSRGLRWSAGGMVVTVFSKFLPNVNQPGT
jgi:hypothetical protein